MSSGTTPAEADLAQALTKLRAENPALGIPKLHSLLLTANPEWAVSEKRTKKILQNLGLTLNSNPSDGKAKYPSSKVIEKLDISKWTAKVDVRFFDKKKGKGLIVKEKLVEGNIIWKEDFFAIAPEWEIFDLVAQSAACSFCTTPLGGSSLTVPCSASSSATHCPARYCNRLCSSRAEKHNHPLLCPARNPSATPLIKFAKDNEWQGLNALIQSTGRILLATQDTGEGPHFEEDWRVFCSFAALGMEERDVWMGSREPLHPVWKKAFSLYKQAFWDIPTDGTKTKLGKILKRPLDESTKTKIGDELFTYEGFLRNLGRMSLNLEGHGGLYILHSHINHSCAPNVTVLHPEKGKCLSRISIVAKRDIEKGEELFASYVNPSLPWPSRQVKLREWSFGKCQCERCVKEEVEMPELAAQTAGEDKGFDMGDLEKELKAGFGVF